MRHVIVCDGNTTEQQQLMTYVQQSCTAKGWDVQTEGCADWPELVQKIKRLEPDIVLIAQDGVEGLDTITSAALLSGKIIWFSDLDFGVQAYRLCVSYFCQKPITYQKMDRALNQCLEN